MIDFEKFKENWLSNMPNLKSIDFSIKILTNWLDLSEDNSLVIEINSELNYGLDLVYSSTEYNKFYFVYNYSKNAETFDEDLKKIFEHINGIKKNLLLSSEIDSIIKNDETELNILIASENNINLSFDAIKVELNRNINIQVVSIQTLYDILRENEADKDEKLTINFKADLKASGTQTYIGSMLLNDLYFFLKEYEKKTNDIRLIYEKNVRSYQGEKNKVNKGIKRTILVQPEFFGIFNNGITIVSEVILDPKNKLDPFTLTNPYIVNGCQTTLTIFNTLNSYLNYEESWESEISKIKKLEEKDKESNNEEFDNLNYTSWKERLKESRVFIKLVATGDDGEELLNNTTKYTNSQVPVGDKDFYSINNEFKELKNRLKVKKIFLEIQKGSWALEKAKENESGCEIYNDYITAIDLVKVYASGWLSKPGEAYGTNPPFTPGGNVFVEIMQNGLLTERSAYCAYLLWKKSLEEYFFNSKKPEHAVTRGKTRFLFYFVVLKLLREIIALNKVDKEITDALLILFERNKINLLLDSASEIIDVYMKKDPTDVLSIYNEEGYNGNHESLKNPKLNEAKNLNSLITDYIRMLKRMYAGTVPYNIIVNTINEN